MARKSAPNSSTRGSGFTRQLVELLEQERRRIAGNLHDGAGQLLNIVKLKLGAMMESNLNGALQNQLQEIDRLIDLVSRQIRSLEYELSPPALHRSGLVPALGWLAEDLKQSYDLYVSLRHDGIDVPLDDTTRSIIFRAVRELLINVARHAEVKNAEVEIKSENYTLTVVVRNTGVGFDFERALNTPASSMGLAYVFGQVQMLGGKAELESKMESGTIVTLTIPLDVAKTNWEKPPWLFG